MPADAPWLFFSCFCYFGGGVLQSTHGAWHQVSGSRKVRNCSNCTWVSSGVFDEQDCAVKISVRRRKGGSPSLQVRAMLAGLWQWQLRSSSSLCKAGMLGYRKLVCLEGCTPGGLLNSHSLSWRYWILRWVSERAMRTLPQVWVLMLADLPSVFSWQQMTAKLLFHHTDDVT